HPDRRVLLITHTSQHYRRARGKFRSQGSQRAYFVFHPTNRRRFSIMKTRYLILIAMAAALFSACEPAATNTNVAVNVNSNAANTNANANRAAAAPTKDEMMTLERAAFDAWKNKNAGHWDGFLASNFTGYGQAGRLDKATAMKEYAGAECDVK